MGFDNIWSQLLFILLTFFLLNNGLLSRKVTRAFFLTNHSPCLQLRPEIICVDVGLCLYNNNTVIETVVDGEAADRLSVDEGGALCTFCEMIVFWIQVQLKEKRSKEKIFHYVDEVISFSSSSLFFFCGITLKTCLSVCLLKLCERFPNPLGKSFINCDEITAMPSVSFIIGNRSFPLSPEQVGFLIFK